MASNKRFIRFDSHKEREREIFVGNNMFKLYCIYYIGCCGKHFVGILVLILTSHTQIQGVRNLLAFVIEILLNVKVKVFINNFSNLMFNSRIDFVFFCGFGFFP